MTQGISYPEWIARYGVPEIVFRNDPPAGLSVSDTEHFSCCGSIRLTTPTPEQIRRAGYGEPEPGFCYARIAMPWGCDTHGAQLIAAIVFAVEIARVSELNAASDANLKAVLWGGLLAYGAQTEIVGSMPPWRGKGWFG